MFRAPTNESDVLDQIPYSKSDRLLGLHYAPKDDWTLGYVIGLIIGCLIILSIGASLLGLRGGTDDKSKPNSDEGDSGSR